MASLGFNATDEAPSTGGGPLPPDEYKFQVIEESLEEAQSGKGEVLKLTFEVMEGDHTGRKLYVNLNIAHENPIAQRIGKADLSALCAAQGQKDVQDSEELLWKPFRARTKIAPDRNAPNDRSKDRAVVQKYIFGDAAGAPPAAKAPAAASVRPAPTARAAAARPGTATAAPRSLPWGQRNNGPALAQTVDDDIPF